MQEFSCIVTLLKNKQNIVKLLTRCFAFCTQNWQEMACLTDNKGVY